METTTEVEKRQSKRKPLFDTEEVRRALPLLFNPGDVFELRALDVSDSPGASFTYTASGYFDDFENLVEALRGIHFAKGVYVTLNPATPELLARAANRIRRTPKGESTSDRNIVRRRWLLIDFDAVRSSGISSTDAQHQAAIDRMRKVDLHLVDMGFPEGIHADSGNGAHLLYRVDLPADDGGLIQRVLTALAAKFDDKVISVDTTVYNPARICKLYGSLVCKGDDIPDHPHRYAKILSAPDYLGVVPVELLNEVASVGDDPDECLRSDLPQAVATLKSNGSLAPFDIEGFIQRHGLDVRGPEPWSGILGKGRCWTFNTSPLCDHHADGPHLIQFDDGRLSASCQHNSCSWTWHDLRARFEPKAATPASTITTTAITKPAAPVVEAFAPFPVEAIPEPLQSFVETAARSLLCDPSFIALPTLAVCATAIGNTRRLRIRAGWDVPAIVWTVDVGESGDGKTPAHRLARAPLMRRQERWLDKYAEERAAFDAADEEYRAAKKQRGAEIGLMLPPVEPVCQREIVVDTTVEGLAPIIQENPRGLLVARDELSGWFGSFDRYGSGKGKTSGDSAHWLSMYNAEPILVDRRTNRTTLYARSSFVCVTGGIQPAILARAMHGEHRESGLLARLLMAAPPRSAKQWTDDDIPEAAEKEYAKLVDALFALEADCDDEGKPRPVVVTMTPDAKAAYVAHYNAINVERAELSGDLAAAWSKLEEIPARLALILHYVEAAYRGGDINEPSTITAGTMNDAIRLANWFKRETRRVYGLLAETNEDRDRRRLVEWIAKRGGTITARQLQQSRREFRDSSDAAEAALRDLAQHGHGVLSVDNHEGKPGRPVQVFTLSTCLQSTE